MVESRTQISNSKLFELFIHFFKFSGLIFFVYPLKYFKISKCCLLLFFVQFFIHVWFYYDRYVEFKDEMLKNTEIMNMLILFYALYDPFVKFTNMFYSFLTQRRIFKLFKNIELFNAKVHKVNPNINDSHIRFLILVLIDLSLTFYTLEGNFIDTFGDFLLYTPLFFYIFIVFIITQRLEDLEHELK